MKRGGPLRRSPIARGTSQLQRSRMKRGRPGKQPPERRDSAILAFTRRRRCCSCNRPPPSHAHHPRTGAGVGIKPADNTVIPLCSNCHTDLHALSGPFKGWVRERLREWELKCNEILLAAYVHETTGGST